MGKSIRTLLGAETDMQLVGEASTGRAIEDVDTALVSGPVSFSGLVPLDRAGILSCGAASDTPPLVAGTYRVKDDCIVELVLELAPGRTEPDTMHFRGIVVERGREVLGIQTDPGTAVVLRLLSR